MCRCELVDVESRRELEEVRGRRWEVPMLLAAASSLGKASAASREYLIPLPHEILCIQNAI